MEFETERLMMRKLTHGDTETVYTMLKKPEVSQYLHIEPQTDIFKTRQLMEFYIDNPDNIAFAILKKVTREFVGVIVLKKFGGDPTDYEITTFNDPRYWNKGYASEVFMGLKDYARDKLGIKTITAGALAVNKASNAVLRKHGFQLDHVEYYPDCPEGLNFYKFHLHSQTGDEEIKIGRYLHFKGNEYRVLNIARHSETLEEMVVYQALYGDHGIWVRPAKMWNEKVVRDGKSYSRFTYIGD